MNLFERIGLVLKARKAQGVIVEQVKAGWDWRKSVKKAAKSFGAHFLTLVLTVALTVDEAKLKRFLDEAEVPAPVAVVLVPLGMAAIRYGGNWWKHAGVVVLTMSAFAAPALADMPNPPSATQQDTAQAEALQWGAWAGTLAIVTESGEKRELIFGRLGANLRLSDAVHVGARLDLTRAQDGGQANPFDFRSFRDLEPHAAIYWQPSRTFPCGPTAVGGGTFSIEGADGPPEPRQWTAAGGVRCGDASGGLYAYAVAGHHGPSGGGLKVLGALQVPADRIGLDVLRGAHLVADGVPFGEGRFVRAGVIVAVPKPW